MRTIRAHWLGRVPYAEAHALQERLVDARIRGEIGDTILLLEHDPVITLGRGADGTNVLVSEKDRASLGIALHETGRGGDVTYHGPGQLVAYPILDLKPDRCDVRRYIHDLAKVMIGMASDHGISASLILGDSKLVGVWVDLDTPHAWPGDPRERDDARVAKLGAIGVRISRWVTMHGFALNGQTDLSHFATIVPCGISKYSVTSLESLGIEGGTPEALARASLVHFARIFEGEVTMADAAETRSLRG